MYGLSNWTMQTITQPAQDIGFGTRVLSAGTKTRIVTSMSSYSGTNTANGATTKYCLLPSQPPAVPATNTYAMEQVSTIAFHQTGNLGSATTPITGFSMVSDRGGAFALFIPPGYILVAFVADANTDGTIIHSIVSGECEN